MLVLLTLHVFEFLPSGLALLDGEAHSASDSGPVGTKSGVFFEFNQAAVGVAVPSIPVRLLIQWWWGWLLPLACCGGFWIWGCCWGVVGVF